MILDRNKFSLQIREYSRYVPSNHTWEHYRQSSKPVKFNVGFREQLKTEVPAEDIMIREMLDSVSHSLLYHNMEFRKMFRKRLIFYNLYYDNT